RFPGDHGKMTDPLTRRAFLARTAAAAGALAAIHVDSPAAQAAPVPRAHTRAPIRADEPLRIGVIGTGGMGTEHCRAFLRMAKDGRADVRIVALSDVCEPRLGNALKACMENGADYTIHAYRDYRQLLADPSIHGVLIASPEHWHARMVEDAIAAGKDVYVEKPMTLRLPEALRLREVVRANPDAVVVVGTQYTTYPAYQTARRLIASPEHWHARMVEDAIAAGKDVYVEKPMTLRLPEALRLREVVRANPDAVVVVGTQYTTYPGYQEAQRLIAEGAIGKPVWSQTSYCRNSKDGEWLYYEIDPERKPGVNLDWQAWCGPLGDAPWDPEVYARWRRYRRYSTGIIGDLLVHRITPLIMALD